MDDKTREAMLKVIAAKKEKSASQGAPIRPPDQLGSQRKGQKKHKKGGLFDK